MNALLDLDGTLTDPRQGIVACFQHALRTLSLAPPPGVDWLRFIGPPLRDAFRELLPHGDGELVEAAVAAYRERFATVGMFENAVYEGIPEALAALRARGARLFVATSKPRVYAERILQHFGLAAHFTAVYGPELDGTRSTKAELIAHSLADWRLSPRDTVMVGDRRHDAEGALANGVLPAGVLWGFGSREELAAAGVRVMLERPGELGALTAGPTSR